MEGHVPPAAHKYPETLYVVTDPHTIINGAYSTSPPCNITRSRLHSQISGTATAGVGIKGCYYHCVPALRHRFRRRTDALDAP